ncbi:MAG: inositol monophosphatase [Bosea sp. (in: a-proteobacteria)]|uniref:inositol monophosphatase family protein n=1 Tax=Bosea sp. (in: a-proteobacteria) TaxID=1871050 RepID=UPI0027356AE8|nr:inositol monophosphatase [Bosea sp. (in: a-proteobacteria)]MDP3257433.1 inositol monophosphatase [Bosea sp. (in: a-proteobacteria)]MDP3319401.1 inositol monophosphatase [Bosea sp. (in: a-proteobacteria)]
MMFSRRDLDRLNGILAEAARREIMPRFRKLGAGEVREKAAPGDLVTEADEAAERFIFAELERAFPGALLVGEEAATRDPAVLARLADAELAFVIDPVDGTLNFASDLPLFAVMAAALVRGEAAGAVIHDPLLDDSALALRGEGAWLQDPAGMSRELRVGGPVAAASMNGMASWQYFPEPMRSALPARFPAFASVASLRCCGQEYRLAAAGRCDFLLYGGLNPWDHAPGVLLFSEAGGHARMLDGGHYRPGQPSTGLLCAPDPESWQAIRTALTG